MNYNNDFKYDLKLGQISEEKLGNIFSLAKIEVKTDLLAHKTKKVYVEYESRGRPSGLSITEADYYCFVIKDTYILISAEELKNRCRKYIGTDRDRKGGDSNTSKGILLPLIELIVH